MRLGHKGLNARTRPWNSLAHMDSYDTCHSCNEPTPTCCHTMSVRLCVLTSHGHLRSQLAHAVKLDIAAAAAAAAAAAVAVAVALALALALALAFAVAVAVAVAVAGAAAVVQEQIGFRTHAGSKPTTNSSLGQGPRSRTKRPQCRGRREALGGGRRV
jgi:hypothetical protein